ncbi:MAG: HDOD domain-containing protein [Microbacteriaceae bacterium]|nr:HDOD domain-containing protein [Burkholderiaceae bacterium]
MAPAEPIAADAAAPAPHFIDTPLRDATAWLAAFDRLDIPVLAATADAVEEWRANEDAVDAHLLADSMAVDPLMTLKLLRHVAMLRRDRDRDRAQSDAETATEALVMLGITPFFRDFGRQPTVEARLADQPEALAGLRKVLCRSHRAARFALGFAVHRGDHDAAQIHQAALLHDFAEMLLWAHAPTLALTLLRWQRAKPDRRSAEAQRTLLHVDLSDLQQALMKAWRLPALLVQISDDHASQQVQVRNVQLAIRLARHSAMGWDNAALPDDIDEIAVLLNLGTQPTLNLLHDLDQ